MTWIIEFEMANCHVDYEARRFLKNTRRRLNVNVQSSKKSRQQEQGKIKRSVLVETSTSVALVSCDGLGGYDWSDQAEKGPKFISTMAFSTSSLDSDTNEAVKTAHGVSAANSKNNSSTLPNIDSLSDAVIYSFFARDGLEVADGNADNESKEISQEDRKESRTVPVEETTSNALVSQCDGFGYDWRDRGEEGPTNFALMAYTSSSSSSSDTEYDKFKSGVGYDSQVFDSQVFDSQVNDRYKTSKGYHVVPPPYTGNFMPPKPDLVLADKDEYVFSESVTSVPAIATSEVKTSESKPKSVSEPLIEDWIFDSENENEIEFKSRQRKPSNAKVKFVKSNEHVKSPRESVKKVENYKQAKYPRKNSQSPRGNKRNLNNLMTQKLGSNFEFQNKACYVCGSFNHLIKDCDYYEKKMMEKLVWNNARRVNLQNSQRMTHPHPKINFVPSAVLMKSGLKTLNTTRQNSSRAAGNPQQDLKDKGVIDSGCSRHMTGNRSYLTNYEEIDGGFVTFGDFKLTDKSHVLLKAPRKDNMYSVDLKNVVPQGGIKNLIDLRVKCDNETKFKNRVMNQFCEMKGIKREFSVARTPQQNGVAERKNRTLIEAARTMLADSKLPTTFWAEAVNIACYVQNRVVVIKPHNKTPYEYFLGRKLALSFMRPFGCPVTILNNVDHLGKFDGKADEGFFVGYSTNSKAFRVFNNRTRIVEENLHTMNYKPVVAGNQSNGNAGTKACVDAGKARVETIPGKDYILLPLWTQDPSFSSSPKDSSNAGFKPSGEEEKKDVEDPRKDSEIPSTKEPRINQEKDASVNNTNNINIVSLIVNAASIEDNIVDENIVYGCADDLNIPELEDIVYSDDDEDVGAKDDMNILDAFMPVSPIPTTRIQKDHLAEQIIRDLNLAPQTRRMTKNLEEHGLFSLVMQQRTNHKDFQNCLFACFLSQEEPKKVVQALKDPSWIEAMQEELLQFKLQEV
ncbi:ribonuclease H-like domain-containing protein [Tanacetum coccineum]